MPNPQITVSEIGEYIRHQSCQRRFKLSFNSRSEARKLPFADRLFNTIDPVLKKSGKKREDEWDKSLLQRGFSKFQFSDEGSHIQNFFEAIKDAENAEMKIFGRELNIIGTINQFEIKGRIDFLIIQVVDGALKIKIVECKASRRDKTYHRIQVCIYKLLLKKFLRDNEIILNGLRLGEDHLECIVARIDESTNRTQDIMELEPLLLDREEDDILQIIKENGSLARILITDINDLSFQLNLKCDDCIFNVHCFSESSRLRLVELLGIDPTAVKILKSQGITTIDHLADIDLNQPAANDIRNNSSFSYNLDLLKKKAQARRKTLPRGDEHPDEYAVTSYGYNFTSQLPQYEVAGERLIRVYLSVDYDYVENRVVGISAHITKSTNKLKTEFGRPEIFEISPEELESGVQGQYVIEKVSSLWNGDYLVDNGVERQLISTFFRKLIDQISIVAGKTDVPIHFYVWSRDEIKALVEACSRVDTNLLSHLNHLLGCRESLEQLIYSCLKDEVDKRFALGWTGRGLSVVTSLGWFGERFHWQRNIAGSPVFIDRAFTQDIFDFKTDLELTNDEMWAKPADVNKLKHKFEIRSRFHDQLTVPYWYAYWGELPNPDDEEDPKVRASIIRYNEAIKPGYLEAFLKERLHALRWVEERIIYKNSELTKPVLNIPGLAIFNLGVHHTRRAALDFLRLDFHIKLSEWISSHILPPINRIMEGGTIPVKNLKVTSSGSLICEFNVDQAGLTINQLKNNSPFTQDSFIRILPCSEDLHRGQTVRQLINGGITATISRLNWETGIIELNAQFTRPGQNYLLQSFKPREVGEIIFDFATIDESVSDFVANRVDARLILSVGNHINTWFDPERPVIPDAPVIAPELLLRYNNFLMGLEINPSQVLKEDQRASIIEGLQAKIHLLLGPPGTGKTMTTAIAVLLRIIHTLPAGSKVLVAANTHMAVNNLLNRITSVLSKFTSEINNFGFTAPVIQLAKIDKDPDEELDPSIEGVNSSSPVTQIRNLSRNSVLILGGTTSKVLKLSENFGVTPFSTQFLVVDEASMMVLAHFLSIATLVNENGFIMLAGDNRQLSPITAHDWEREDRPPVIKYQPFLSAYDAISNLRRVESMTNSKIRLSSLKYTFRLPADVRDLIARLYREDHVILVGQDTRDHQNFTDTENVFEKIWQVSTGIFLITHNERDSRKSNVLEAKIVKKIVESNNALPPDSVAIITPHRAQRTLLTSELESHRNAVTIIDTVERLQGGEKANVIVSATASDPSAIGSNAEFILNLNRANVAFSRAQKRLVVICSEELINYIPSEVEYYDSSLLWKTLRRLCSKQIGEYSLDGYNIHLQTIDRDQITD
jgi:hypothetical protein